MPSGCTAIIRSSQASSWQSCKAIVPNLERAYRRAAAGRNVRFFKMSPALGMSGALELAREIAGARPSRIVFIDHEPHPAPLLAALAAAYGSRRMPPVIAHVYGDFTLGVSAWAATDVIPGLSLLPVCASERQAGLVSTFLRPGGRTCVFPFPTDEREYGVDAGERAAWRRKLGARSDDFVILYAGRLSLQKNILRLIGEVARFRASTGIPAKLFLAGEFDDLGAPFFGLRQPRHFFYQHVLARIAALPPAHRDSVRYLGNFGARELRGLYNAADAYASLSLHHDEDYGMAPAESLFCGTPALLTEWGGYSSFLARPECQTVPVELRARGWRIRSSDVQRGLLRLSMLRLDAPARRALSAHYRSRCSISACAKIAEKVLDGALDRDARSFRGFNPRAGRLERARLFGGNGAPFPQGPASEGFYREIYGPYCQNQAKR